MSPLMFTAGGILLRRLPVPDDLPPELHLRRGVGRRVLRRGGRQSAARGHAEAGQRGAAGARGLGPQPPPAAGHGRALGHAEGRARGLQPAPALHRAAGGG